MPPRRADKVTGQWRQLLPDLLNGREPTIIELSGALDSITMDISRRGLLARCADEETACSVFSMYGLALRRSETLVVPAAAQEFLSIYRKIRSALSALLMDLVSEESGVAASVQRRLLGLTLRTHVLRGLSRLLSSSAQQLRQRPSRHDVDAAAAALAEATSMLVALDGALEDEDVGWEREGDQLSTREAIAAATAAAAAALKGKITHASSTSSSSGGDSGQGSASALIPGCGLPLLSATAAAAASMLPRTRTSFISALRAELWDSQLLEAWASCYLQLSSSGRGDGMAAQLKLLDAFLAAVLNLDSEMGVPGPGLRLLPPPPALQYLLALQAVRAAVMMDGGSDYGLQQSVEGAHNVEAANARTTCGKDAVLLNTARVALQLWEAQLESTVKVLEGGAEWLLGGIEATSNELTALHQALSGAENECLAGVVAHTSKARAERLGVMDIEAREDQEEQLKADFRWLMEHSEHKLPDILDLHAQSCAIRAEHEHVRVAVDKVSARVKELKVQQGELPCQWPQTAGSISCLPPLSTVVAFDLCMRLANTAIHSWRAQQPDSVSPLAPSPTRTVPSRAVSGAVPRRGSLARDMPLSQCASTISSALSCAFQAMKYRCEAPGLKRRFLAAAVAKASTAAVATAADAASVSTGAASSIGARATIASNPVVEADAAPAAGADARAAVDGAADIPPTSTSSGVKGAEAGGAVVAAARAAAAAAVASPCAAARAGAGDVVDSAAAGATSATSAAAPAEDVPAWGAADVARLRVLWRAFVAALDAALQAGAVKPPAVGGGSGSGAGSMGGSDALTTDDCEDWLEVLEMDASESLERPLSYRGLSSVPSPSARAMLTAGLVPTLEHVMRRSEATYIYGDVRSWSEILSFGPLPEITALAMTAAKAVRTRAAGALAAETVLGHQELLQDNIFYHTCTTMFSIHRFMEVVSAAGTTAAPPTACDTGGDSRRSGTINSNSDSGASSASSNGTDPSSSTEHPVSAGGSCSQLQQPARQLALLWSFAIAELLPPACLSLRRAAALPVPPSDRTMVLARCEIILRWCHLPLAAYMSSADAALTAAAVAGPAAAAAPIAAPPHRQWRALLLSDVDLFSVLDAAARLLVALRPDNPAVAPAKEERMAGWWFVRLLQATCCAFPQELGATLMFLSGGAGDTGSGADKLNLAILVAVLGSGGAYPDEQVLGVVRRLLSQLRQEDGEVEPDGLSVQEGPLLPDVVAAAALLVPPGQVRGLLPLRLCGNPACVNLDGPSEAALKLRQCGRCGGAVAYCGRACQVAHWAAGHRTECLGGQGR